MTLVSGDITSGEMTLGRLDRLPSWLSAKGIEITSWLVSAYDFYSRVVKNRKRTSERSERVSLRFFTTSE